MRVLVLGGTRFLGKALVDLAVGRGWEVAAFNRGVSGEDVPGVRPVRGDRTRREDLDRLARLGPWDVVVDVAGVIPAQVRDAARVLGPVSDRYVFVSTVSAYRDWPAYSVDERSPLHDGDPDAAPDGWSWGAGVYGPLKAGAESAARREVGERNLIIVRPSVILGPHEYSSRLTWWLKRIASGGRFVAPGAPERRIQPIDVRDVAAFVWDQVADEGAGTFNIAAPIGRDTFGGLIRACIAATGSNATPEWIPDDDLDKAGIRQWTQLPLWRTAPGTWNVDTSLALRHGLRCRPLEETVTDTWRWLHNGGRPYEDPRAAKHGLSAEVEQQLLDGLNAGPD
ncbi:NAD-dependent epimerase/dehydratase family protein [Glycomyces halotolerans]